MMPNDATPNPETEPHPIEPILDPRGENGQAMVEYVILVAVIAAFLSSFYVSYTRAVRNNFDYLTHCWQAPVP